MVSTGSLFSNGNGQMCNAVIFCSPTALFNCLMQDCIGIFCGIYKNPFAAGLNSWIHKYFDSQNRLPGSIEILPIALALAIRSCENLKHLFQQNPDRRSMGLQHGTMPLPVPNTGAGTPVWPLSAAWAVLARPEILQKTPQASCHHIQRDRAFQIAARHGQHV